MRACTASPPSESGAGASRRTWPWSCREARVRAGGCTNPAGFADHGRGLVSARGWGREMRIEANGIGRARRGRAGQHSSRAGET